LMRVAGIWRHANSTPHLAPSIRGMVVVFRFSSLHSPSCILHPPSSILHYWPRLVYVLAPPRHFPAECMEVKLKPEHDLLERAHTVRCRAAAGRSFVPAGLNNPGPSGAACSVNARRERRHLRVTSSCLSCRRRACQVNGTHGQGRVVCRRKTAEHLFVFGFQGAAS
jgi:hypothetical protein